MKKTGFFSNSAGFVVFVLRRIRNAKKQNIIAAFLVAACWILSTPALYERLKQEQFIFKWNGHYTIINGQSNATSSRAGYLEKTEDLPTGTYEVITINAERVTIILDSGNNRHRDKFHLTGVCLKIIPEGAKKGDLFTVKN